MFFNLVFSSWFCIYIPFTSTLHNVFYTKTEASKILCITLISHKEHTFKFSYLFYTSIIHNSQKISFQSSDYLITNEMVQIVYLVQPIYSKTFILTPLSILELLKLLSLKYSIYLQIAHKHHVHNINSSLNILLLPFKSSFF